METSLQSAASTQLTADQTQEEFAEAAVQRSFGLSTAERPNDAIQDAVCVEGLK
jgi:hypothetical protein